jgi:hypothetical protein
MRPSLRKAFVELVLVTAAALPAAGCGITTGGCPDPFSGEAELFEPLDDAELQALVDACRDAGGSDLAACEPMCFALMEREGMYAEGLAACSLEENVTAEGPSAWARWTTDGTCVGGRRPAGYAAGAPRCDVGGYFAEQARLEAASVRAFLDLARALAAHRAPRVLIDACRRAAGDEIVHAVITARLARRFGGMPLLAPEAPAATPSLEELARANAVEGCVREAWGAVVATWQAGAAADPHVRAAMRRIAPDETRHATLSRAIDRWAMRRLDDAARARIAAARAGALAELAASVAADAPAELVRDAGLPAGAAAAALFSGMSATVASCPKSSSAAARS